MKTRPGALTNLLAPSAGLGLIYGGSVGVLLVAELALSRTATPADFGEYQYARQLLPFLVAGALFGSDQALTRHILETGRSVALRSTLRRCIRRMVWMSVIASVASAYLFNLSTFTVVLLLAAPFALVVSELSAACWRARHAYARAALAQQGYRLVTGVGICALIAVGYASGPAGIICLLAATVATALWCSWRPTMRSTHDHATKGDSERPPAMAVGFGVSMLAFPGIDWADQAAVAYSFDGMASSGEYAAVKLATVYPFISVASIVGFIALPEVLRRRHRLTVSPRTRAWGWVGAAAVGLWLAAYAVLSHVAPAVLGSEIPGTALLLLCAAGVLRVLYVIPSSVLGAIGSTSQMVASGIVGCLGIALEALVIIFWPGDDPVVAGACGLLTGTAIRVLVAHMAAMTALRRGKTLSR